MCMVDVNIYIYIRDFLGNFPRVQNEENEMYLGGGGGVGGKLPLQWTLKLLAGNRSLGPYDCLLGPP